MRTPSQSRRLHLPSWVLAAFVTGAASCSRLLGIEPLPSPQQVDAAGASDRGSDGGAPAEDAGGAAVDFLDAAAPGIGDVAAPTQVDDTASPPSELDGGVPACGPPAPLPAGRLTVIDGSGEIVPLAVAIDRSDRSLVVAGAFAGTITLPGLPTLVSRGERDGFVIKYSSAGAPVWARALGGPGEDRLWAVAVDSRAAVVVAGRFEETMALPGPVAPLVSAGGSDAFVVKLGGADGALSWAQRYGGAEHGDAALALKTLPQAEPALADDLAVVGQVAGPETFGGGTPYAAVQGSGLDGFVTVLAPDGRPRWAHLFGGGGSDAARAVTIGPDGALFVTGDFQINLALDGPNGRFSFKNLDGSLGLEGYRDVVALRYARSGALVWASQLGGPVDDGATSVEVDNSGVVRVLGYFEGAWVTGSTRGLAPGGFVDTFLAELDATSGQEGASVMYGSPVDDYPGGLVRGADGDLLVTGSYSNGLAFTEDRHSAAAIDTYVLQQAACGLRSAWQFDVVATGAGDDVSYAIDAAAGRIAIVGTFVAPAQIGGTTASAQAATPGYLIVYEAQ